MAIARSVLQRGVRLSLQGLAGVTAISSGATYYVYKTDESWKRCIDFHMLITPMCYDYYKYYSSSSRKNKNLLEGREESSKSTTNSTNTKQEDEDDDELQQLHQKYAPEALQIILNLGGYYIKCAQMFCGMNMLPQIYEDEFSILLDQVPPKSYEVIEKIILEELGGTCLDDHYFEFDRTPIAAASIGQVHCAKLLDTASPNKDVVVKIQYPEVEKYFHLDVLSIKNLCKM